MDAVGIRGAEASLGVATRASGIASPPLYQQSGWYLSWLSFLTSFFNFLLNLNK